MMSELPDLPVAAELQRVINASRCGRVVVTAPPGSGKTTLVPGAILDDLAPERTVVLVQPRRMAARAVARRIAALRGVNLGGEVGYQVRFDRRSTNETRLLVATTGILLRRLMDDLELPEVGAVVLDEFHERTVEMDLVLGLLVRIQQTIRADLRIVVMSATLDAASVAAFLDPCPVVSSAGRMYPVQIHYEPRRELRWLPERVAAVVPQALRATDGHVLAFLPGVGEILRSRELLEPLAAREQLQLLTLYGDLPPEQQDRALADLGARKLILSTNIAETSLTIDGVTAVIDSGEARQLTVHPAVGLPRLELAPISQAAADQRAGRAGRTGPGHCWRLWEQAAHAGRRVSELPEILRSEFAQPLLQLLHCGERDLVDFPWLDPPPADAVVAARRLLLGLGAIDRRDRVTDLGAQLVRLPLHPRLGRLLLSGATRGVLREAALAAALLSERDPFRAGERTRGGPRDRDLARTRSDLVDRVLALQAFQNGRPPGQFDRPLHAGAARQVLQTARQLLDSVPARLAAAAVGEGGDVETALRRTLLDAFPDRLARLRSGSQDRGVLVGGRGVCLDPESQVRGEPLFLCLDLNDATGDARVRMASSVEAAWLPESLQRTEEELIFHPSRRQVEARRRTYYEDLLLEETPTAIQDTEAAAALLARHAGPLLEQLRPADDQAAGQFRRRVQWLAAQCPELDLPSLDDESLRSLLPGLCWGLRSLDELRRADWMSAFQRVLGHERLREIDRLAPTHLTVPSGNRLALVYQPSQPPLLAVRIQEMFGLPDTPRIAGGRFPVLLHLLGPNYRVQQVTPDLASFWKNTYPEVKKELKRRYPKHAWPDDPLSAPPLRSGGKPRNQT